MKRLLVFLFLAAALVQKAAARSDDITIMGNISPLFYLDNSFSETVITSDQTELTVEVSDIAVDEEHIYVRFFLTDVPESLKSAVTDDNRLYGSYLPVAEIFTADSTILTPSSASRYSLLEFNSRLIIGGMLVFDTSGTPQTFYLNFNQIPFDMQPLNEGFSKAVILSSAKDRSYSKADGTSVSANGLEFSVTASAQTNEYTMLQPSVRMERPDESVTKFGWITVKEAETGKRFAVTRGNLYGFNLTDDSYYAPAHSYVFSPVTDESPIQVTMEQAYIRRTFESPFTADIDLRDDLPLSVFRHDDIELLLTELVISEEEERIRMYLSGEGFTLSDISFSFPEISEFSEPTVSCGKDLQNDKFACDLFFHETGLPKEKLNVRIHAVEYRKDGPWTVTWNPVPMEKLDFTRNSDQFSFPSVSGRRPDSGLIPDESVRAVLDSINARSRELTGEAGWIHEAYRLDYQFRDGRIQDLIPVDQSDLYFTNYISENWYRINRDREITEQLAVIRDPETNRILSAQQQTSSTLLDLVHALQIRTDHGLETVFSCFPDFTEITGSAAVFSGKESCSLNGERVLCLNFYQSLNGVAGSSGSQNITFMADPDDLFIRQEIIDYDLGALTMTKTTTALEKAESLPDDLAVLIGSVK